MGVISEYDLLVRLGRKEARPAAAAPHSHCLLIVTALT